MNKPKKLKLFFSLAFFALVVVGLLNFQTLRDFLVSKIFSPSEAMLAVENSLNLTTYGKTLFRASSPELEDNETFNENCKTAAATSTVLGCYTNEKIHIFHVESDEFPGIIESTSAHELLHASWARLSEKEKSNFSGTLEAILESSGDDFKKSLESYADTEKLEEIYVRSATQLKALPESLEKHFATIFSDQDSVVDFYESYSAPFLALEENLSNISSELDDLRTKIDTVSAEYSSNMENFTKEVEEFNSCAETVGCFSNSVFFTRRNELLSKQAAIESLYQTLDDTVTLYNEKVETYNSQVIYGQHLENLINSNKKPKESL